MAADVTQCKSSNIKCYVSAFSNILIRLKPFYVVGYDFLKFLMKLYCLRCNFLQIHLNQIYLLHIPPAFYCLIGNARGQLASWSSFPKLCLLRYIMSVWFKHMSVTYPKLRHEKLCLLEIVNKGGKLRFVDV